jgi:LTR polyprotein gag-polypeptide-like protein/zinc knuckle protein
MSLTSNGMATGSMSGADLALPKLLSGCYAEWRPRMETTLMRVGVAVRDYQVENTDWTALVEAVEKWERADEDASIAYALGRSMASSSKTATAVPSAAEKEVRRAAMDAVARGKKAYTMLYQTLPDELRRLVAEVPQGYAYGLWSWLEKRFQSTEQDNVGDLWDKFTALYQADEETFDEYKARVDAVHRLLTHAKDKPSAGLYAHRVLWKLSSRYRPAVLALKASGKLKDAEKIDWSEIVSLINNHERSEARLAEVDSRSEFGMAVQATGRGGGRGGFDGTVPFECYNCGEKGHIARYCKKPSARRTARQDEHRDGENDGEGGDSSKSRFGRTSTMQRGRGDGSRPTHRANAAMKIAADSEILSDDEASEDGWGREVAWSAVSMVVEDRGGTGTKKKRPGKPRPTRRPESALSF